MIFHDAGAYPGTRWVDRVRRATQQFVMRKTAARVDRVILPANSGNLPWLTCQPNKVVFIPVGSNIPATSEASSTGPDDRPTDEAMVVAVFGITRERGANRK